MPLIIFKSLFVRKAFCNAVYERYSKLEAFWSAVHC